MFSSPFGYDSPLPGVEIVRANRGPCIVCGHPTGDCTGPEGPNPMPPHIASFPSEKKEVRQKDKDMFWVENDVYEEVQISNNMKIRSLIVAGDTYIPLQQAKDLGLA